VCNADNDAGSTVDEEIEDFIMGADAFVVVVLS